MGTLLLPPRSGFPALRNVAPLPVDGRGKESGSSVERPDAATQQQQQQQRSGSASVDAGAVPGAAAEPGAHASAGAGKLFVFRDPPQSCDLVEPPRRKKKSFLNLKKSSVAPTDRP